MPEAEGQLSVARVRGVGSLNWLQRSSANQAVWRGECWQLMGGGGEREGGIWWGNWVGDGVSR